MTSLELIQQTKGDQSKITLKGQIDENADYSCTNFNGVKAVGFDFAGVSLINSTGLQHWIKFLETIPASVAISFDHCPVRVVNQINMFPGFLAGRDVAIESFFAPYYCEACDTSKSVLLNRKVVSKKGRDVVAPVVTCDKCKAEMEFDGIEKKYFLFLTPAAA